MTRRLTIADAVRQPLPGLDAPTRVQFTPDGQALTYLIGSPGSVVRSLWRHELATGERRLLAGPAPDAPLSRDEELQRERRREKGAGISDYQAADDGTLLIVTAGQGFVSRDGRPAEAVVGVDGVQDARLSPDGQLIAFVRGDDLHVVSSTGGAARRLTDDAEPGVFNGLAEYIAAEELGRLVGTWWSADSSALAFAHVDEREVATYPIPHLGGEDAGVEIEAHRYPFAGARNASVSLRVVVVDGDSVPHDVDLGMAPDDYLARVVTDRDDGWLVAVLPRDQRSLHWLRVGRDGAARELWVEHSQPWLNLDDDTRVLSDGRILRTTERTGLRHLELRTPDGGADRQLTSGRWIVSAVVGVDEERGEVLALTTRAGVLERHVDVIPLAGGAPRRLTDEHGWHAATLSRDCSAWIDTWSSLDAAPAVIVRSRLGAPPVTIHAPSETAETADINPPELLEVCAADGTTTLHAALYRPAPGDQPPPAIVWVYGGPHSQKVADDWALTVEMQRQLLRQAGFAVLVVDNRGTANRGIEFEAVIHAELGRVEVADQAAAVRELAGRGELDIARVGITGGSYGGYMTLLAMMREPELFRAGAASAPVTDWHLYDSAYTERYMGTPATNPEGYRAASLLTQADALTGKALVLHGLIDENVHFRHTARLLAALTEAEKDVDLVVFPGERHGERADAARRQRLRRPLAFFEQHLLRGRRSSE
jgi:dipeptidyl-peptidase-4